MPGGIYPPTWSGARPPLNVVECPRDCKWSTKGRRRGYRCYRLEIRSGWRFDFPISNFQFPFSGRDRRVRRQLCSQAPLQFLAHFRDFHPGHHDELAAQHLVRLVLIRQLATHAAILAILIPAEAPIRNSLRADKLEAPQKRIPLWDLKLFPKDADLHEFFIRPKGFRHDKSCSPSTGLCRAKSVLLSRAVAQAFRPEGSAF